MTQIYQFAVKDVAKDYPLLLIVSLSSYCLTDKHKFLGAFSATSTVTNTYKHTNILTLSIQTLSLVAGLNYSLQQFGTGKKT